ncbi:MAG: RNA polymerase sigma factor [Microbacterium sp.]|uniref:RNA polymerase sigma factor n=1 Tax=Microbacterium sp. TaxID=51671 RepID=UPI003F9D69A1
MSAELTSLLEVSEQVDIAAAFRREAPGLLGFFIKRGVSVEDAADLVSETFLAAWKSSKTSSVESGMLRAWLFGIARKILSRYRRGRVRRSALSDRLRSTLAGDQAAKESAEGDHATLAQHVRSLIRCLPEIDQEIVRLVYWDGFTQEEVAIILGKPATAVRTRLSRARKVLRNQLADSGDVE